MEKFFKRLDDIAQINRENKTVMWLERIAFIFLTLMFLCAPHSIAASQTAWLCGMLAWAIRLLFKPRPAFFKTPLNSALWLFFGWAVISGICSYAPDISLDRLRNVSLFLIFVFVVNNLRHKRAAVFLALALIGSCLVNALWTPLERIIGRGIEISVINADSPLEKANLVENKLATKTIENGDTVISANKKKVSTPEELVAEIEKNEVTTVNVYHLDYYQNIEVKKTDLLAGNSAAEKLGIENWKHNRNWRSAGFYGHFTTYAEVLQLIASLACGIIIALFRRKSENTKEQRLKLILSFCLAMFALALLMTATRASQAAFAVSTLVMLLCAASRKTFWVLTATALPLILLGAFFLQQSRNVGFYDTSDNSTAWRQIVYREGFNLLVSSPRHLLVGVGMDSIKRYAKDWHLFDDGRLPIGHFHSTPLQLAVERGIPSLLLWLWIVWLYGNALWKKLKSDVSNRNSESLIETGIILGCFGGLIGFFTSGLVHYNLGDGEVAMVFYALMGIGIFMVKSDEIVENSDE